VEGLWCACFSYPLAEAFCGSLKDRMAVLSRYESAIERAMMKALHELQRLQAARINGTMFPPIAVDVEINS